MQGLTKTLSQTSLRIIGLSIKLSLIAQWIIMTSTRLYIKITKFLFTNLLKSNMGKPEIDSVPLVFRMRSSRRLN